MAGTMTPTTADDLEGLLEENGGVGEWENESGVTERWSFPRFPGADLIGTCDDGGEDPDHEHTVETDADGNTFVACDGFVVDAGNMYLSRSGIGYDTDVETVAAWLDAPRNVVGAVLLLGDPGTGKTALAEAACTHADRTLTTVVCTPDHTKDSLFLRFMGEGKGEGGAPYALGPVPFAAREGHTLYMDEAMLLVDGLKPILYALADGRRFLPEGNVDGSPLEIHPDFRLILSSNPLVRGASLPEPLGSRCATTTLYVETSEEMLHDLNIDEAIIATWKAIKDANLWTPQIRELRLADYWLPVNADQAVSAFTPEHCPESQRKQIRNMAVGLLGGGRISDMGRLVVK